MHAQGAGQWSIRDIYYDCLATDAHFWLLAKFLLYKIFNINDLVGLLVLAFVQNVF